VGLACADGQPAEPELHALLAALQQAVTGLCLSLHSLMGDAGPSLRQDLELMIKAFAERNASLVRTIPKPTELPRAVGMSVSPFLSAGQATAAQFFQAILSFFGEPSSSLWQLSCIRFGWLVSCSCIVLDHQVSKELCQG